MPTYSDQLRDAVWVDHPWRFPFRTSNADAAHHTEPKLDCVTAYCWVSRSHGYHPFTGPAYYPDGSSVRYKRITFSGSWSGGGGDVEFSGSFSKTNEMTSDWFLRDNWIDCSGSGHYKVGTVDRALKLDLYFGIPAWFVEDPSTGEWSLVGESSFGIPYEYIGEPPSGVVTDTVRSETKTDFPEGSLYHEVSWSESLEIEFMPDHVKPFASESCQEVAKAILASAPFPGDLLDADPGPDGVQITHEDPETGWTWDDTYLLAVEVLPSDKPTDPPPENPFDAEYASALAAAEAQPDGSWARRRLTWIADTIVAGNRDRYADAAAGSKYIYAKVLPDTYSFSEDYAGEGMRALGWIWNFAKINGRKQFARVRARKPKSVDWSKFPLEVRYSVAKSENDYFAGDGATEPVELEKTFEDFSINVGLVHKGYSASVVIPDFEDFNPDEDSSHGFKALVGWQEDFALSISASVKRFAHRRIGYPQFSGYDSGGNVRMFLGLATSGSGPSGSYLGEVWMGDDVEPLPPNPDDEEAPPDTGSLPQAIWDDKRDVLLPPDFHPAKDGDEVTPIAEEAPNMRAYDFGSGFGLTITLNRERTFEDWIAWVNDRYGEASASTQGFARGCRFVSVAGIVAFMQESSDVTLNLIPPQPGAALCFRLGRAYAGTIQRCTMEFDSSIFTVETLPISFTYTPGVIYSGNSFAGASIGLEALALPDDNRAVWYQQPTVASDEYIRGPVRWVATQAT